MFKWRILVHNAYVYIILIGIIKITYNRFRILSTARKYKMSYYNPSFHNSVFNIATLYNLILITIHTRASNLSYHLIQRAFCHLWIILCMRIFQSKTTVHILKIRKININKSIQSFKSFYILICTCIVYNRYSKPIIPRLSKRLCYM